MTARTAVDLDAFLRGYLVAALWSSNDESDESGGVPLDDNYGVDDIHPESVTEQRDTCSDFVQAQMADLLEYCQRYVRPEWSSWELAGHDFWLTRNGHGVGFWDRGLGELGDRLSAAAKVYGEAYPYVGDDGKVHF